MANIIEYHNVELRRKELTVLKDVNFSIEHGQFVYLIGKVGSGKSTLLKSIYADTPINEGEAQVLDYDLASIKRRQVPYLRRQIGFVFQDFQLLSDRNVYANLEFVLNATGWKRKAEKEERIEQVLKAVGMEKKFYKMPHELSGGEQQRIAIARALLNKPKLILADEPTGNLDPHTSEQIMARLYDIALKGTTVMLATHNLSFLPVFEGTVLKCEKKRLIME
ncbi:MAG: ATP-binding cassette domain-containing protein [Bacteroidales bacterium]|nr:ATP-binding cassette domain-containing protein [Bacteroidales bacterium]MCD8386327.1 ATP-binding cassette domain-containing protein [Bacteroidales bacterium]